ncbi:MAG TPA: GNAT family N-acetyltransferase [Actinomycetota bacterium]|nr:GNAT family N-acetyltransferase [Actinomycetota bacterium]
MDSRPAQTSDVRLRDVEAGDIEILYDHQLDPEATAMAAFPARDRESHVAHWNKILKVSSNITRTIVAAGQVAGWIGSWVQDEQREIGYWIGKAHWGQGVATSAVEQFLQIIDERPLYAWVARHNTGSKRVLEKCGFLFDRDEGDHVVFKIA